MKFFKTLSKRGLALFLVLTMCSSLLSATALAAELEEATHKCNEDGWICDTVVDYDDLICTEHVHSDECYVPGDPELDCNVPTDHSHGAECYDVETGETLICEIEENHVHVDACYTEGSAMLDCGIESTHKHEDACYAAEETHTAPSAEVTRFLNAVKDIPAAEDITTADEEKITGAWEEYMALTPADQANYAVEAALEVLEEAEAALAEAKKNEKPESPEEVRNFVDAMAEVPGVDEITEDNAAEVLDLLYTDEMSDGYAFALEYLDIPEVKAACEKYEAVFCAAGEILELTSSNYGWDAVANAYYMTDNGQFSEVQDCINQSVNTGKTFTLYVQGSTNGNNLWFPGTLTIPNGADVVVTSYGNPGTIWRGETNGNVFDAPMFNVEANAKLTLRDVTLDGRDSGDNDRDDRRSNNSLISLYGELVMASGATIIRAQTWRDSQTNGGAVYVHNGGKFTMQDGSRIEKCSARDGGAVYVESNGAFTADAGAVITGCWTETDTYRRWVYVEQNGTFTNKAGIVNVVRRNADHPELDGQKVYLTVITEAWDKGIPSEPVEVKGRGFFWTSETGEIKGEDLVYSYDATSVIKSDILTSPDYIQSTAVKNGQQENVWGVADPTGEKTKSFLNLDDAAWTSFLGRVASAEGYQVDSSTTLSTGNQGSYEIIPYVVKYQGKGQESPGWHIDCAVLPINRIQLGYELNLPNGVSTTSEFQLPTGVYATGDSLTTTVGSLLCDGSAPTGISAEINGHGVTLTFTGWKDDDGKDYAAGVERTFEKTTVLSAQWEVVGETYTITYNGLEGSSFDGNNPNPTSYSVLTLPITLKNPTHPDNEFLGWTGEGITAPSKDVTIPQGSTGDRVYTANWQGKTVTSVELNTASVTLYEPKADFADQYICAELTATVEPDTAVDNSVSWTSSDERIATVDANGKVTALKAGTATITATAGGKSATCAVTVKDPVAWNIEQKKPYTLDEFTGAFAEATAKETIQLLADVDLAKAAGKANINIRNTNAITLDLNGHTLKGTGNGSVITVDTAADLTLKDSRTGGKVTGGNAGAEDGGGGVYNAGKFTMNSGIITGNTAGAGAGVWVDDNATFTMNGGEISSNTASNAGGGVWVDENAVFNMNKGKISENTAKWGGGVIACYGSFNMHDGVISQNTARTDAYGYGGGVLVYETSYMTMDGGEIINNSAKFGGGVFISCNSEFTMTGGKLCNNTGSLAGDDICKHYDGEGGEASWEVSKMTLRATGSDWVLDAQHGGDPSKITGWFFDGMVSHLSNDFEDENKQPMVCWKGHTANRWSADNYYAEYTPQAKDTNMMGLKAAYAPGANLTVKLVKDDAAATELAQAVTFTLPMGSSWTLTEGSDAAVSGAAGSYTYPAKVVSDSDNYVYVSGAADGTVDKENEVVTLVYSLDNWKDSDKTEDPDDKDSETGGDGIPDSKQVLVKYAVADDDSAYGEVTAPNKVEVFTPDEDQPSVAIDGNNAKVKEGQKYAFAYWTNPISSEKIFTSDFSGNGEKVLTGFALGNSYTYTAHFLHDEKGGPDPENPGDGTPDEWQVFVKYVALGGGSIVVSDPNTENVKLVGGDLLVWNLGNNVSTGTVTTAKALAACGKTLKFTGWTASAATGTEWKPDLNAAGNGQNLNSIQITDAQGGETYTLTANFTPQDKFSLTVKVVMEDKDGNQTEVEPMQWTRSDLLLGTSYAVTETNTKVAVTIGSEKPVELAKMIPFGDNGENYTFVEADETVADNSGDVTITLIYTLDQWHDGNPDKPTGGDGTPDYKQALINYVVVTLDKDGKEVSNAGSTVTPGCQIETFTNTKEVDGKTVYYGNIELTGKVQNTAPGYAFAYWTKSDDTTTKIFEHDLSEIAELTNISGGTEITYTAIFLPDTKGGPDPENPGDGTPDEWQVFVKYVALGGGSIVVSDPKAENVKLVGGDLLVWNLGNNVKTGTVTTAEALAVCDKTLKFTGWTASATTGTEWKPDLNAAGNGQNLNSIQITDAQGGETYTLVANWKVRTYDITVKYLLSEDHAVELKDAVSTKNSPEYAAGVSFGTDYDMSGLVYQTITSTNKDHPGNYALDGDNDKVKGTLSGTADEIIVELYYSLDELEDPDKDPDPGKTGDGIPDKYQITVNYAAVNGTVSFNSTVVTKYDTDGNPAVNGTAKLAAVHIPTASANTGYGNGTWARTTPVIGLEVVDGETLTITYTPVTGLSYTVNYLEQGSTTAVADAKIVGNQTYGDVINSADEKVEIAGYNYVSADKDSITIGTNSAANVINLYYAKRTDLSYTVNYLLANTTTAVADAKIVDNQTFGAAVTEKAIDIIGYNKVDPTEKSITIAVSGNVINFYYTRIPTPVIPGGSTGGGGGGTTIPSNPTPVAPNPGENITDENPPLAHAVGLNDVDHFAYVIGYTDDTVRPLKNITRAEVATIFFRLMTDEYRTAHWATTNSFSDVNAGSWYNNAISTCANAGLLTGDPDGRFRPNDPITRAEFAVVASRFLDDSIVDDGKGNFSDTADHWAAASIRLAAKAGWISGDGNRFRPDDNITRAEVMTAVNRMLDRVPDADHMLPNMHVWIDNPKGEWYYEAVQEATNEHAYERDEMSVETWTELLVERDWAALEAVWAGNGGAAPADTSSDAPVEAPEGLAE